MNMLVDQGKGLTKKQKILLWEEAHRASVPYFFEA